MNFLTTPPAGGLGSTMFMMVLMIAIFYFMLIRPENKRKKEAEQMRSAVKKGDKTTIIGALGYFILPLDILPDFIPMVGFTDDLSAILLALHAVWKNITPEIKAMAAAKASELFGDFNQQEIDDQLGR